MHRSHEKRFKNPKTVQLFDRYATYNGSDPYQTPATLSIIPHLEYNIGAFFPKGGIISIPRALHRLATELGVKFQLEEKVSKILTENNTATGLVTDKGSYAFDYIASNADIRPSYEKLLAQEPAPKKLLTQPKSSSGIIFYWGIDRSFNELGVHNIFFSDDYKGEFKAIFEDKTINDDPTIYLHISSKMEKSDAPKGGENWFILMNVPANEGQDWDALVAKMRKNVISKISRNLGVDVAKHIVAEDVLDPIRIEERTSSSGGALRPHSPRAGSSRCRRCASLAGCTCGRCRQVHSLRSSC
jgi:phytoene dehydrogenase-like protein